MALHKIKDFDPDYRDYLNDDIIGFDVYSDNDKVGSVDDVLVDEEGEFRYLVVNTGVWIFGKKVLLPMGRARIYNNNDRRVYVNGLTRQEVENLPEYNDDMTVDYDYEESVRGVHRPAMGMTSTAYDRDTYNYDRDAALYNPNDRDRATIKLYEERLKASKTRRAAGEVTVGKRVETETARVEVPLEKERVVIERTTPTNAGTAVGTGERAFQEGEVARIEVYEEVPDIRKETVLREEVNVRKETQQESVTAEERLRREELEVNSEGQQIIDRDSNPGNRL
ncbi:MAG: DUF2382 domain-containing protein [Cyanosarcina radialis HA8281-LM2]|jgi:uncharacterized protein (TIGR02271 family)|nr:DUF2382 domain-containing protein [Cyanosarcina radialis HA8281-LM2]